MKIAVGIPVFNDAVFIEGSVNNCLDVGYDNVVYLDDGSTDDTYEKLLKCTKEFPHIEVLHLDNNTVDTNKGNRWDIVTEECRKFSPDWIMVRAADERLSYPAYKDGQNKLYKNLEILTDKGYNSVTFRYIDFWRSEFWYRIDGYWGNRHSRNAWKNDTGWEFVRKVSGIHYGAHFPDSMAVKEKNHNINIDNKLDVVVLHYGMSSQELLARKLEYNIKKSIDIGSRANGVSLQMTHPNAWHSINGYKIAYERPLKLKKADQVWFKDPIPDIPEPKFESLYSVVRKYNEPISEEYAKIYGR